ARKLESEGTCAAGSPSVQAGSGLEPGETSRRLGRERSPRPWQPAGSDDTEPEAARHKRHSPREPREKAPRKVWSGQSWDPPLEGGTILTRLEDRSSARARRNF